MWDACSICSKRPAGRIVIIWCKCKDMWCCVIFKDTFSFVDQALSFLVSMCLFALVYNQTRVFHIFGPRPPDPLEAHAVLKLQVSHFFRHQVPLASEASEAVLKELSAQLCSTGKEQCFAACGCLGVLDLAHHTDGLFINLSSATHVWYFRMLNNCNCLIEVPWRKTSQEAQDSFQTWKNIQCFGLRLLWLRWSEPVGSKLHIKTMCKERMYLILRYQYDRGEMNHLSCPLLGEHLPPNQVGQKMFCYSYSYSV